MKARVLLVVLSTVLAASAATTSSEVRRITFEVTLAEALPEGEKVFVTGNQAVLGYWRPDATPLEMVAPLQWSRTIDLPADELTEFKITKGSWDTEQLSANGSIPANHELPPGGAPSQTVRIAVHRWKGPTPRLPAQITGDYRVYTNLVSRFVRLPRDVIVWLPPSYATDPGRRYPVLYMHDGQQVFDPRTSSHNQDWEVDEWCTRLIRGDRLREIIVVAVNNSGNRRKEYDPSALGRRYARFLCEELKPFIDREYRTLPGLEHTAVAGSSMGGKISFYLAWAHPDVFSAAACLSPAFTTDDDELELSLVREAEDAPPIRVFLYCGLGDEPERELIVGTRRMAALLRDKGFVDGKDLLLVEDPAGCHTEAFWAQHTDEWLTFLFPPD